MVIHRPPATSCLLEAVRVCMCACMCVYVCAWVCACVSAYACMCMCACAACACVCLGVCVRVRVSITCANSWLASLGHLPSFLVCVFFLRGRKDGKRVQLDDMHYRGTTPPAGPRPFLWSKTGVRSHSLFYIYQHVYFYIYVFLLYIYRVNLCS